MICYLDSCRDKTLKLCTPTKFQELTESQRTSMLIDAYRTGENPDAKSQLPAFVFMGIDPKMLSEGVGYGSRKKSDLVPTGLVMFDFDHISKIRNTEIQIDRNTEVLTPHDVYDRFLKLMPHFDFTLENDLALAHITPSGDGLRIVMRIRKGKTIAETQKRVGEMLGIECDKAVKDLSRLSFCPKSEDILYLNKSLLFGRTLENENSRNLETENSQTTSNNNQTTLNNNNYGNNSTESNTNAFAANDGTDKGQNVGLNLQDGGSAARPDSRTAEVAAPALTTEPMGGGSTERDLLPDEGTRWGAVGRTDQNAGGNVPTTGQEGAGGKGQGECEVRDSGLKMQDSSSADAEKNPCNPRNSLTEKNIHDNSRSIHGNSCFPQDYHGVPYASIVEKWLELRGGKPEPGDRHATLVELAMDLRKICDNDKEWIASLMPDFDKGEQEKRDCIEWAVGRQHSRLSGTLLDALKALGVPTVNNEERKVNDNGASADSSLFTIHSSLSEQSEDLPPALPAELPNLVKLMTSKVLPHQKPAVASMMFPALATHVNNCLFKLRDNTDVELSLMCCLFAPQSVGKGCVKPPLREIMADIRAEDRINRQREKEWQESQKNKKANEKGKSKPDDLVVRVLSSDTTPAAFLGRLMAAEHGNGETPNLCTYSQVDEIEDLYSFCSSGGRNKIQQMIKRTWDRDDIGAERWSANSANIMTVLRWNWAASSTIEGGRRFFKACLTDGTTSRVDFCTIIAPQHEIDFCYGDYDEAFRARLRPYIDNLKAFRCEESDDGKVVPRLFPQVREIEERMNQYINRFASTMPDDTWANYAWRAKVMAIKKLIVLYIANGEQWEDAFEEFAWWSFHYSMWCKINLFYDAAAEQFADERITSDRGHRSPLKSMKRQFTYAEFAAECRRQGFKTDPHVTLRKYKHRGVVTLKDDVYTISPEFCDRNGVPEASEK